MKDHFYPGAERAGDLFTDRELVDAVMDVEQAWLDTLVDAGIAPATAEVDVWVIGDEDYIFDLDSETDGNVVIPSVSMIRDRVPPDAARWLHRGLTSQDVLDTALVICTRRSINQILADVRVQAQALVRLAEEHRSTVQAGRTLGQHAVPTTFGAVAAGWLHAILDGAGDLRAAADALPVQFGGAAGTRAGVGLLGDPDALLAAFAARLELPASAPWHTNRRPVTRVADALVACTDAWGKIAGDVVLRSRPEIAEVTEPSGGGSSTMPHKQNPVRSTLIRRTALAAPLAAAELHLCAVQAEDERPAGAWHAEWPALRRLGRGTAVAASLTAELLTGLSVDADRMRRTAEAAVANLLSEQRELARLVGAAAATSVDEYLGETGRLVDDALARGRAWMEGNNDV